MAQDKVLNIRQKRQQKYTTATMLIALYIGLQIVWGIWAYYNQALEQYLGLVLMPLILGIGAIVAAIYFEANYKLVFYAAVLFSVGQLVQSVIQEGDGYLKYQKSFQGISLAMTAGCILLIFFLRSALKKMNSHRRWMEVIVIALMLLSYLMLVGMIVSKPVNGAHIQIAVGSRGLQIMEFIKPISVIVVAGIMYVPNIKWYRILWALFYTASVTGICLVFCNEFGTGCVVFLMGMLIIIIFQNSKISLVFIAVIILGMTALVGVFYFGNSTYKRTAMDASDTVFAQQYTSCSGTKSELMEVVRDFRHWREREDEKRATYLADGKAVYPILEDMENSINQALIAADIKTAENFTFEWFETSYLRDVVQDKFIATSSLSDQGVEKYADDPFLPRDIENRKQFLAIMEILVSYPAFRNYYFDHVVSQKVFSDSAMNAYRITYMNETSSEGEAPSTKDQIVYFVFKSYCSLVHKFEDRLSGVLNPEKENLGSAYQVNRARRAMATGGWFGNPANIKLHRGLFAADSDMVFAVAVSELGCVMGEMIIILNMLIFLEMVRISLRRRSQFLKAVCAGIAFSWMSQVLLVIAGNCRFFMLTGMTLPFVANGGMSLLDSALMIALLAYLSTNTEAEDLFSARERVEEQNKQKKCKNRHKRSDGRKKPKKDSGSTAPKHIPKGETLEDYLDFLEDE